AMVDVNPQRPSPPPLDDDCALFLDVDGTLVDFTTDPSAVRLLPAVREDIGRIADRLDGAVALVSGRPLAQLDALFAPLRLPAAGLHGHQMRGEDQAPGAAGGDSMARLQALHRKAAQLVLDHPGVQVEDKGVSLALHWRAVPQAAEAVTGFARRQLDAMPGFRLQPGDHVVEFVPEGSDKGRAVERMMARAPFAGRVPVF